MIGFILKQLEEALKKDFIFWPATDGVKTGETPWIIKIKKAFTPLEIMGRWKFQWGSLP
jgi:hypothetical protein